MKFTGIIFDMDGVLTDTEQLGRHVWQEVGKQLGRPEPGDNYLDYVGRSWPDSLADFSRRFGADFPGEEFKARCQVLANEMMEQHIPLKPGVFELLDFLKEHQVPISVATSTLSDRAIPRLKRAGLLPYFRSVTTGDQVVHSKPDPDIYLLACRELGMEPGQVLAIEDSRNGILSAHAAGMMPIMVPDLIPPTPELEALLCGKFDSLLDVRDYLATIL